ncbi:MAG: bifunctional demethylmenaquinone methyltransferase/2-methoxy-6-polyprenyl-1,4-benzoquinol methylase UbiE [Bacteroidales bacterium]|nr:bifunctional demethylmenaquinone methyltransferase/2-methoxy-6-polyprenyl-1,4-benzoquinol methylase UbiE [Bacteroidales bacterium]
MTNQPGKKEAVRTMFDNIAGKYDFLNHFLSAGIDKLWRKKVVNLIVKEKPTTVLDVATGTADLAIELSRKSKAAITGIDISKGMLDIGHVKLKKMQLDKQIMLQQADSENIPFPDNHFDVAMVAFGVRNFENLHQGLIEMQRVTRPGGLIVVLEFSKPRTFPVKQLYHFYFKNILPTLGKLISKDHSAYTYLPDSVGQFPDGMQFMNELEHAGFKKVTQQRLTFGIASIYTGRKPQ